MMAKSICWACWQSWLLTTGFALLLLVFARHAWRVAVAHPESTDKVRRIRAALGRR